jgi:hypothetical protein
MPTEWQHLLVYGIVLLTLGWLAVLWWRGRKRFRRCGGSDDCGCPTGGVKRNPVIERYLKKREDK